VTVVGGLYQVWLLLGFSYLAGIDLELEEEFRDGSLFFYSISLIFGVGITWFGLADRSLTDQKINTVFFTFGGMLMVFATVLYVVETLSMKKFHGHMWSNHAYFVAQLITSFVAIVVSVAATVYYETKHSTKSYFDPTTSSVKPLTAAVQARHIAEE
jgi:hypothetical protein